MPNIAKVLKDEIQRLARKEVKSPVGKLRKDTVSLKRAVAGLKRQIAQLLRDARHLMAAEATRAKVQPQAAPEAAEKLRFTAKGIRALRQKLKLSQADFARLVGVTPLAVYQWERKPSGRLRLHETTRQALTGIRGIGVREARKRLEAKPEQEKKAKSRKPKRKGRRNATRKAGAKSRKKARRKR